MLQGVTPTKMEVVGGEKFDRILHMKGIAFAI